MTGRGCTTERRVETDYHRTDPSVAGCTQANDSSVVKISNVSPARRYSPRLKAINAIYKEEDAMSSNLQQTSGDDNPSSNQSTVESDPNDPIVNVTLKDLQKRCKSRKRKAPKSVDSSTSDLNRTLLKPKEQEDDLEEPLICLKLKKSNKYSMGKQRKYSHPSESMLPVEERTLQTPYQSFCRKENSSPVKTDSSSIAEEVAAEDECNSIPESVNCNLEVSSDEDPLHVDGRNINSIVKSEIVETCNAVISSSVFIDDCYTLGGSTRKLSQKFCEEESADGESYSFPSKFLDPCVNRMETASCYSSPTQTGASLVVNISQSVNEVKDEGIGIDPLAHNSAAYVSASSDLNFIGTFNDLGNSSSELHERTDGSELEHGNTTSFMAESLDCCINESSYEVMEVYNCANLPESSEIPLVCCVNEVSIEFTETDNYTSPESGKEHFGEKIEVGSSEMSCNKLSPSVSKSEMPSVSKSETPTLYGDNSELVSITEDLSLDVCSRARNFNITLEEVLCDCIMNQMDSLAMSDIKEIKSESNSLEFRMGKEFENQGDDVPVLEEPVCSRDNNVTTKCSILSRAIYDFHTSFRGEVGSLDSLVLKALGGAPRNNSENHVLSHVEKGSFVGTYDCCDPHSSFSSPCDTHAVNASSSDTESLHCSTMNKMSNHNREKTVYSEVDAEELINSHIEKSFLVGMYDPCIPRDSNTSFSSACDSYAANENTPESESSQWYTVYQTLHSCAEKAANSPEISAKELVEALECHSPQDSFPGPGAVNGLLNVEGSLSKASKRNQYSAENTLYRSIDMPSCHSSETSNLVEVEGSNMENVLKCDRGVKVEHPLKNLLSNRQDLSPTSQDLRAFNGNKLGDVIKTATLERKPDEKPSAGHEESSERVTKKSKGRKNGSLQTLSKGILKSQDRNCSCSKNSLIHMPDQKAVTFSQRQMQDIEKIATQLLKGLTSMKNIVMESVGSEACSSASSNFTSEEINVAIEDASNLEATTKKWLSMMARDCNRFCKIMKSTENRGAAASVGVRKQPKKITFADEAGGLLCHVKIFEQLPEMMNSLAPMS